MVGECWNWRKMSPANGNSSLLIFLLVLDEKVEEEVAWRTVRLVYVCVLCVCVCVCVWGDKRNYEEENKWKMMCIDGCMWQLAIHNLRTMVVLPCACLGWLWSRQHVLLVVGSWRCGDAFQSDVHQGNSHLQKQHGGTHASWGVATCDVMYVILVHLPVTPAQLMKLHQSMQLMRAGIGWNVSCTVGGFV